MIARIWRGWTTPENADAYEALLRTTVFSWIVGKKIAGLRRYRLRNRGWCGPTPMRCLSVTTRARATTRRR